MDTVTPLARIDVISDAICPWCYIGKRQLESALKILDQDQLRFSVMWHPYQLNPDMPAEGVERATYRAAKFGSAERAQAIDQRITETAATATASPCLANRRASDALRPGPVPTIRAER